MTTVLAEYPNRRAAHGQHVCGICRKRIAAGERYIDQRVAADGTVYTFRCHRACNSAYWSWIDPWDDEGYTIQDLSSGHVPPCSLAWAERLGPCSCGVER